MMGADTLALLRQCAERCVLYISFGDGMWTISTSTDDGWGVHSVMGSAKSFHEALNYFCEQLTRHTKHIKDKKLYESVLTAINEVLRDRALHLPLPTVCEAEAYERLVAAVKKVFYEV